MRKGRLYVLSGPSGTGKGTICKAVMAQGDPELALSVSMTTRAPREGEIDGVSYYFVTQEEYDKTVAEDGFLEHAGIYGNCYGTPKAPALEKLESGIDVILEIEMQGAMQVKRAYPDARLIFVLPPSLDILRNRLRGRGTENEEQLQRRTASALEEIQKIADYDYYVVNDELEGAVARVNAIISAGRLEVDERAAELVKKYEEEK
ncbi:MAG: guanylate kinase [Clostridia bacterium]|nr:guanylate kinase [Clostridia bacterium]